MPELPPIYCDWLNRIHSTPDGMLEIKPGDLSRENVDALEGMHGRRFLEYATFINEQKGWSSWRGRDYKLDPDGLLRALATIQKAEHPLRLLLKLSAEGKDARLSDLPDTQPTPTGVQMHLENLTNITTVIERAYESIHSAFKRGAIEASPSANSVATPESVRRDVTALTTAGVAEDSAANVFNDIKFSMSDLCDIAGTSDATIRKYAKNAGVECGGVGKRDHRFTRSEAVRIIRELSEHAGTAATKKRCREWLGKQK